MKKLLFLSLVILGGLIASCGGGGGGETGYKEETNSGTTQVTNPEPINEPPQIDEPVQSPETPPQLASYTKTAIVKIENDSSLLIQSQASDGGVYYKKQGDIQYTPCDKDSENLYKCEITYYEHELKQNVRIIFTYDLKLFNITDLEKIHKEETPEVVISEETTNELKDKGIVQDVGNVLTVEFPNEKNATEGNFSQPFSLNISDCIYK